MSTQNLVSAGQHLAELAAHSIDTARGTGHMTFRGAFCVSKGPDAGRFVPYTMTWTDNSSGLIERTMLALGWNRRDDFTDASFPTERLRKPVLIEVEHVDQPSRQDPSATVRVARVRWVNGLAQAYDPPSESFRRGVFERFMSAIGAPQSAAAPTNGAALPPSTEQHFGDAPTDEEIPF